MLSLCFAGDIRIARAQQTNQWTPDANIQATLSEPVFTNVPGSLQPAQPEQNGPHGLDLDQRRVIARFEGAQVTGEHANADFWGMEAYEVGSQWALREGEVINTDANTGRQSVRSQSAAFSLERTLLPSLPAADEAEAWQSYVLSAYVKVPSQRRLTLRLSASSQRAVVQPSERTIIGSAESARQWQYVELYLHAKNILGLMAALRADGAGVLIDDVRIGPAEADFTAQVFDQESGMQTARLGTNGERTLMQEYVSTQSTTPLILPAESGLQSPPQEKIPLEAHDSTATDQGLIRNQAGQPRFWIADQAVSGKAKSLRYRKYDRFGRVVEEGTLTQSWQPDLLAKLAENPVAPMLNMQWKKRYQYGVPITVVAENDYRKGRLSRILYRDESDDSGDGGKSNRVDTQELQYDAQGHIASVAYRFAFDLQSYVIRYRYNAQGKLQEITFPSQKDEPLSVQYHYDQQDRISTIGRTARARTINDYYACYTYDAKGALMTESLNNSGPAFARIVTHYVAGPDVRPVSLESSMDGVLVVQQNLAEPLLKPAFAQTIKHNDSKPLQRILYGSGSLPLLSLPALIGKVGERKNDQLREKSPQDDEQKQHHQLLIYGPSGLIALSDTFNTSDMTDYFIIKNLQRETAVVVRQDGSIDDRIIDDRTSELANGQPYALPSVLRHTCRFEDAMRALSQPDC